ncbi:MAG: chemotaxis protein CheA [Fimbriimonadia bacterium]|jgi:two-component system chemotaxis sensor kinase CheA
MVPNPDTAQYLDLFLEECAEQIAVLEREILALEQDPCPERIQAMFRAAHTVKGSSRAMGFQNLAELTHEMENVLDRVRGGALPFTHDIADVLLHCLDALKLMHESISSGSGDGVATDEVLAALRACAAGEASVPSSEAAFTVTVVLRDDCEMPYLRAFLCITVLGEMGTVLGTTPAEEEMEQERFGGRFSVNLRTERTAEEVRAKLGAVPGVADVSVITASPLSPKPTPAPPAPADRLRQEISSTVRVDVGKLDALINLAGELVVERSRLGSLGRSVAARYGRDPEVESLVEVVDRFGRITEALQEQVTKARMLPIGTVFQRLPRAVRDIARKTGKRVSLTLDGEETEVDRSVIEAIGDPLLHLVRNSVDHGIEPPEQRRAAGKPETGTIRVSARHECGHIIVDIADDGAGIDAEKLRGRCVEAGILTPDAAERLSHAEACRLVFQSGVSTAEAVSEVSGRGVGMDIVRNNLQQLGGVIAVDSVSGLGTTFTLHLPLTLAIARGLLVMVGPTVFVIPVRNVVETVRPASAEVHRVQGNWVLHHRGLTVPLVSAADLLGLDKGVDGAAGRKPVQGAEVVVLGTAEQRFGLIVDRALGDEDVVIKPLGALIGRTSGVAGATILGDGSVGLILDVAGLAKEVLGG